MKAPLITTSAIVCAALAIAAEIQITHLDAKATASLIKEKQIAVLDVRSSEEFADGHIAGAKNIDVLDNSFEKNLSALDKTKPYIVYCASGGRSTRSLETFKRLGFTTIYHLDGGINSWKSAGLPLSK